MSVEGPAKADVSDLSTLKPPASRLPELSTLSHCPSVALFVDRAQAVQPDFRLTQTNAAAIAALCTRLDGLPLAIELAAARAGVLTPHQMLARLTAIVPLGAEPASGRFALLVSRQRDTPLRHRSLRAALDWSHGLLSAPLQRLFAQLSVFRGGWTLEAAEAVCGDLGLNVLDGLEQLRECSLVLSEEASAAPGYHPPLLPDTAHRTTDGHEPTAEIRFRLLETMREYGSEQLAAAVRSELGRRHALFFVTLAEAAEPELAGPNQWAWLERLEQEHDNLRAALDWCQGSGVQALRPSGVQAPSPSRVSHPTQPAAGPPLPETEHDARAAPECPSPAEIALRLGGALGHFGMCAATGLKDGSG